MSRVHIVLFRRDLRLHDHRALNAAAITAAEQGGTILPLYIVEPDYWALPEHSRRQFEFVQESLIDLDDAFKARGNQLHVVQTDCMAFLSELHKTHGIASLHAHSEPHHPWTDARTRRVEQWCRNAGIAYREQSEQSNYNFVVDMPITRAPTDLPVTCIKTTVWPDAKDLGFDTPPCLGRQKGGRREGGKLLRAFSQIGSASDRAALSGPDAAQSLFIALSPHLSYGTISLGEAWHGAAMARNHYHRTQQSSIAEVFHRFQAYLKWHDQAANQQRSHKSLPSDPETDMAADLNAWQAGSTGYPLIDASQRALAQTGSLSWRLRAYIVSFAKTQLGLNDSQITDALAACLVDHHPGLHAALFIHLEQTAIGSSPTKVALDLDPDGLFVREWMPELAALPTKFIHQPWAAPAHVLIEAGLTLGANYPSRIARPQAQTGKPAVQQGRTKPYWNKRPGPVSNGAHRRGAVFPHRPHPQVQSGRRNSQQLSLNLQDSRSQPLNS